MKDGMDDSADAGTQARSGTHRPARTAALYASTSATVNWTLASRPVLKSEAVALCARCGGRVVGRTEADYSCINCGRYPMDQQTGIEFAREGNPGSGRGRQFSGAAAVRY